MKKPFKNKGKKNISKMNFGLEIAINMGKKFILKERRKSDEENFRSCFGNDVRLGNRGGCG